VEFTEYLGMKHLGMQDGEYILDLELEPRHLSRAERAHGGVLFTLLDTALGRALLDALPEGRGCATVELKINYFRPVQSGRVRARGRLVNLTRSIGYSEGEVRDGNGRLLARATGSFFLTETLEQSERERV
jgi:uncharacterized protein (TIGR00369 family)